MKIEIKKYRSCRANEGDAYSYDVHVEGKRVAEVEYGGTGGPTDVRWLCAPAQRAAILAYAQPLAVAREEREEARKRASSVPGATTGANGIEWGWWAAHLREDSEAALLAHLDWVQESARILAKLRRAAAKEILCRRERDADGRYCAINALPTPLNLAKATAQGLKDGFVVINVRPESEWLSLIGVA